MQEQTRPQSQSSTSSSSYSQLPGISKLSIQLKELPHDLTTLPPKVITELKSSHELLSGLINTLPEYKTHSLEVFSLLESQTRKLNKIVDILKQYNQTSIDIDGLIVKINEVYGEFSNHELIQYKLLSGFNQDFLKSKFKRLIEENDNQSKALIPTDLDDLKSFKESRKMYHLRTEKLNRWNEDRVTGFI